MKKTFKGNNFTATFTDENGYFSLTGNVSSVSGAIGDKLIKIDPRFKLMEDMHLSNAETGEPMHSWQNANYFIKKGNLNAFKNQLRHCQDEYLGAYNAISEAKDLEKDVSGYNVRVTKPAIEHLQTIQAKIIELWKQDVKKVYALAEYIPEDLTDIDETINLNDFVEPDKVQALSQHLETHFSTIEETTYNDNIFEAEGSEWLVVTDEEADDLWEESLDSYLEDCVYPELPDNMQNYFDDEKWKQDAKIDGRGHSLNRYDGSEYSEKVNDTYYFIYQQ